jgi:hypothetical protein
MHFTAISRILWAVSFLATTALLAVLTARSRWRQFPVFTAWAAFGVTRTILLFTIYAQGNHRLYADIYWASQIPDFALQLGIAFEIARVVLRPTGTWVRDARLQFGLAGITGAAAAAAIAWWVSPPVHTPLLALQIRGNLFTSLVICELVVAMSLTANRLGLGWRNHVMALGQGLTAWTAVMVVTTALQSFWGAHRYVGVDYFRIIAYTGAAVWWMVQLWMPEPQRQPISPELESYIVALHRRVEYDLRRLDAGS